MKRREIKVGSTYRGPGPFCREHLRRVESIDERAAYSSDSHVVTYSRLYNGVWDGGFTCTLSFFASWAQEEELT